MSTREIILRTRKNIFFNFNTQSVEDALGIYIKDILGFNRGFEMSEVAWQALSNLATSKPLPVKLDLINGLCRFSRDKIDEIIVGTSSYPTITPDNVIYQISEDGSYVTVSGCADKATKSITISSSYDGLPVTSIDSDAFNLGCANLESIQIPDSIISIGTNAFATTAFFDDATSWENGVLYLDKYLIKADKNKNNHIYYSIKPSTKIVSDSAFEGLTSLDIVMLPASLVSIGKSAFKDCSNLEDFIIPNNVKYIGELAFNGCKSINDMVIPDSVTSIGSAAFGNCGSLSSLVLPFIGNGAEYNYIEYIFGSPLPSILRTLILTAPCEKIAEKAFSGCSNLETIIIPDSVTSIGEQAFSECQKLTNIIIPDSTASIGELAFSGCKNLQSAVFRGSLSEIPYRLFAGCEKLIEFIVPEGVSAIGAEAFRNCTALNEVIIPDSVVSIAKYAFENCSSLTKVYYTGSEEQWNKIDIGENEYLANAEIYFNSQSTKSNLEYELISEDDDDVYLSYAIKSCASTAPEHLVIPNSYEGLPVTRIGADAFKNASFIKSIEIPNSVKQIGADAFRNCTSLTNITIHDQIESIDNRAFFNTGYYLNRDNWENGAFYLGNYLLATDRSIDSCNIRPGTKIAKQAFKARKYLTEVTLPSGITSISQSLFDGCKNLNKIIIPDSVTSIGKDAFSSCENLAEVRYLGTEDQWNTIEILLGNDALLSAQKYFITTIYPLGDNITFYGDDQYGHGIIEGTGQMYNFASTDSPLYNNTTITSINIGEGITSIGNNTFNECTNLASIDFPRSLTSIGNSAFQYTDLWSIDLSATNLTVIGNDAFANCGSLSSIAFPRSLTSIGEHAFYSTEITSVDLSNTGLKTIGEHAFEMSSLESIKLLNTKYLTTIENGAFLMCTSLASVDLSGSKLTHIWNGAFCYCEGLFSVVLPASLKIIEQGAFDHCDSLTEIHFEGTEEQWNNINISSDNDDLIEAEKYFTEAPEVPGANITFSKEGTTVFIEGTGQMYNYEEGESPFHSDPTITTVYTGADVTSIGSYTFKNCSNLTSLSLAESLMSIGNYAFYGCALDILNFADTAIVSVGQHAFAQSRLTLVDFECSQVEYIGNNAFADCADLTTVLDLPETLKSIGNAAFENTGLANISFTSCTRLKSIGNYAFSYTDISSVNLSNTELTYIGSGAFCMCANLSTLRLPGSLQSIGEMAFEGCSSLTIIYFDGTEAMWEEILGSDTVPNNIKIICSDT